MKSAWQFERISRLRYPNQSSSIPPLFYLHASRNLDLERLLLSKIYKDAKPVIVYTMFQNQADQVAYLLGRKGLRTESYHGGKSVKDRQAIQKRFMKGGIEVLVATIAFGLGVNKSNVRGVIHYSLPKSIENYVQEIGRSGRDGELAFCHLLLSRDDYVKQRCFSHSEGVEEASIWKLLLRIFGNSHRKNPYKSVPLEIDEIALEFDMNQTQVTTLLQYIKLEEGDWISDFGSILKFALMYLVFYADCKLSFTKSLMSELAKTNPLVELICKCYPGTTRSTFDIDTLSVSPFSLLNDVTYQFCEKLSAKPEELDQMLRDLRSKREVYYENKKKSFYITIGEIDRSDCEEFDDKLEALKNRLCEKLVRLEKVKVDKIEQVFAHARVVTANLAL